MGKLKIYIQKTKNMLVSCPRLLMIFGVLIGISITCFAGSIFIKNTNKENSETKEIVKEDNPSTDTISDDSLNRVVNAVRDVIDDEYNKNEDENQNSDTNYNYENKTQNDTNIYNNESGNTSNLPPSDTSVLNYFDDTYNMIATSKTDDKSMVDKIKEKLNVISDFLFDGGEIGGYTYNELSDEAKLKINKLTLSIDSKIDDKFPNYKNKIKQSFNNLKGKVTIAYLDTVDKVCAGNRQDLCDEAKKDFNKMKDTFKITFSMIKDLIVAGKTNLVEYFSN